MNFVNTQVLVLIDTFTGTPGGSQMAFNTCASSYPVSQWLTPPLYFASTGTAVSGAQNSYTVYYPMPSNVTVKYGLVACQLGGPVGAGTGGTFTIYTDIPRRRAPGE